MLQVLLISMLGFDQVDRFGHRRYRCLEQVWLCVCVVAVMCAFAVVVIYGPILQNWPVMDSGNSRGVLSIPRSKLQPTF